MLAVSSGTIELELSLADDHASRVLAEMPRQSVNPPIEVERGGRARMRWRHARLFQLRIEFECVRKIAGGKKTGESIQDVRWKIERLADLAHGAAPAKADDVGGHRGTVRAVTPIDLLNHGFAPVAARQIEIDVRPRGPALAEESLEEELRSDGIAGGDAERITHRAVGGAAAPLHEDALPACRN